jgi:hypothetical protein
MSKNILNNEKIIYSINTMDVQKVAEEELGRKLDVEELKIIEDEIGDYIDWYQAIKSVIDQSSIF